ncbi:mechanosensitive ion channel family protein [Nostocoides sp. HKS02]|uniref:mechanosensitive ion channel domain-containing protein n=1 Tax=Nostocoides sp. HKS02 TaxID=1813880 RepID=UPI0012B4B814|nr:mechanosensitive ion channel family protein [Tetrasphaera sp. HKS02]QGN57474.1 mechanosensitive ion channel [Tetrasphaera sp. HKS02]
MINLNGNPLIRPDLRRAAAAAGVAAVLLVLLAAFGSPQSANLTQKLLAFGGALGFVVAMAISVRSAANEVARVAAVRAGPGTASGLRLGLTVVGYLLTGVVALTVLRVPIEKLLLSGAITGVVIGIAAQQALANLFAGLVLLTSRPFQIGQSIVLRSGALGGEYSGRVIGIGLAYTEILTEDGPYSLPNAGVLAAAVGPRQARRPLQATTAPMTTTNDPTTAQIG